MQCERGEIQERISDTGRAYLFMQVAHVSALHQQLALFGFNLRVFLLAMYDDIDEPWKPCAFTAALPHSQQYHYLQINRNSSNMVPEPVNSNMTQFSYLNSQVKFPYLMNFC